MKDAVKKVNKTALDYFRQNQPVYTENELQEAIKIAHEAGVEAERKRTTKVLNSFIIFIIEDKYWGKGIAEIQIEAVILGVKAALDVLTNQGETK